MPAGQQQRAGVQGAAGTAERSRESAPAPERVALDAAAAVVEPDRVERIQDGRRVGQFVDGSVS